MAASLSRQRMPQFLVASLLAMTQMQSGGISALTDLKQVISLKA